MAIYTAGFAEVPIERRLTERSPVECRAQLHLTIGIRVGVLLDLSESGARIQTDSPPRVGTTALLKWETHEAFCKVMWAKDDMCGVAFDRPLKQTMLLETLQQNSRPAGPIAAVGNIPLGQKRSR